MALRRRDGEKREKSGGNLFVLLVIFPLFFCCFYECYTIIACETESGQLHQKKKLTPVPRYTSHTPLRYEQLLN
jgi:hypothetical protein